ncbi:MAG: hypothetical protein RI995_1080 [Bacteroidota bacterium]
MKHYLFGIFMLFMLISCSKGDSVTPAPTPTPAPVLEIGTFSLELPENNKDCESGTVNLDKSDVEFKWKVASNASKYELKITDLLTGSITTFSDLVATSKIISLTRGKSYSWGITASNASGKSLSSTNWKFYLAGDGKTNRAPNPAKAIYPIPGSTITLNSSGTIKFEWLSEDPDKDVLNYTIRIDTLNNQKYSGTSLDTKNAFQEIKLIPGKIYYWSILSKDESTSTKSDLFTFLLK